MTHSTEIETEETQEPPECKEHLEPKPIEKEHFTIPIVPTGELVNDIKRNDNTKIQGTAQEDSMSDGETCAKGKDFALPSLEQTKLSPNCTKMVFGCKDDSKVTVKKLITVCMHGDETCGMVAINELIQEGYFDKIFSKSEIATTRVTVLLANPKGVEQCRRFIDVNLNRIFMESKLRRSGSITAEPLDQDSFLRNKYEVTRVQKIADEIADCDYYIDIHSTSARSFPFALPSNDAESEIFAASFNVDFVIEKLVKSVRGTSIGWANLLKKPAVCFECGQHTDRQTVEIAKTIVRRFVSGCLEGTAKAVLTCSNNEVIRKGFKYVNIPQAFQKVNHNELLAIDEEVGEIRCSNPKGAYIIMPTANPILGEEAWFWGEIKELGTIETKPPEKTSQILDQNRKKINNLRRSLSMSREQK